MNDSKNPTAGGGNPEDGKTRLIFGIVLVVFFGLFAIYLGAIWFDSEADVAKCFSEFSRVSGNVSMVNTYAVDDFWVLNLGQGIKCTTFWLDGKCLTHTDFVSGTLTEAQVNSSRYC